MKSAIILACCLAVSVQAARPLEDVSTSRNLLAKTWGSPRHPNPSHPYQISNIGCPNYITFGPHTAYALPSDKLLAGRIQLRNRGRNPYRVGDAGFFLHSKLRGFNPIRGSLKCPKQFIPANGFLDCGFVAPAANPLIITSFQPYFVPISVNSPCFCDKPLKIAPFNGGVARSTAQATATANNGPANALATALGQAFGSSGFSQAISRANAFHGNALGFAESICDAIFGPSSAEALSTAEAKGWGNAAAKSNAAATSWGSWSDAKGVAIGTATHGQAAANSNAQAQAFGGGASVTNKAVATGKFGANAIGTGSATAQGGPAVTISNALANTACGAANALNKAAALGSHGAIAAGGAQATTGCGPASAASSTEAVVTGKGVVGPAIATDSASASGSSATAQSNAAAVNAGHGPALAESKAEAKGMFEKSATSNAVAHAANGPAVARAVSVSG